MAPEKTLHRYLTPISSQALRKFLASQYVNYITSSPLYPKSNGFSERQIKTMKTALDTAKSSGKSLKDLLLSLRSTPIGPHLPFHEKFYTTKHQISQDNPLTQ